MKTVIIGGAARCALGTGWAGTGEVSPQQSVAIQLCELPGSESFSQCHSVRDGTVFAIPPPSRTFDVVIVGGVSAGLPLHIDFAKETSFFWRRIPGSEAMRSLPIGKVYSIQLGQR